MSAGSRSSVYPPLDVLKPVADGIWVVDSGPLRRMGIPIPVRMTIIRLADGDLLLHSPTPYHDGLRDEMERHGRIAHLLAPNSAHWVFVQDWQARCPAATTWAAPGLRKRSQVKASGVRLDHDLGEAAPAVWAAEIDQTIIPGGAGFNEVAMFHRPSGTLILTDLVVNIEAKKLPLLVRPGARLAGVTAPDGKAPIYLRIIINRKRAEATAAAARLLAWNPERVIFTHGRWFDRDGAAQLRNSLRWLLP